MWILKNTQEKGIHHIRMSWRERWHFRGHYPQSRGGTFAQDPCDIGRRIQRRFFRCMDERDCLFYSVRKRYIRYRKIRSRWRTSASLGPSRYFAPFSAFATWAITIPCSSSWFPIKSSTPRILEYALNTTCREKVLRRPRNAEAASKTCECISNVELRTDHGLP